MLTKSIAIIDDELDLVELFKEALEIDDKKYSISTFTDPIEALNNIKKSPRDYALVISDYKMPGINGNELCFKLMNINPKLKVILISAYEDIEYDSSKFIFLKKPIPVPQLLKVVKETLAE